MIAPTNRAHDAGASARGGGQRAHCPPRPAQPRQPPGPCGTGDWQLFASLRPWGGGAAFPTSHTAATATTLPCSGGPLWRGVAQQGAHFDGTQHHRSGWKGDCQLLARRGLWRGVGGRPARGAASPSGHRGHTPAREHTWRCAERRQLAPGLVESESRAEPLKPVAVSRGIARQRDKRALQGDMLRWGDWLHPLVLSCQVTLVICAPRSWAGCHDPPPVKTPSVW